MNKKIMKIIMKLIKMIMMMTMAKIVKIMRSKWGKEKVILALKIFKEKKMKMDKS